MTLNQCTKDELIIIVNKLAGYGSFSEEEKQNKIGRCLIDISCMRAQKLLKEAENWGVIANDCRTKYLELLKKYDGTKLIDVPVEVIKKMEMLLKDAQDADKKWDECMRKVDNNG